MKQLYIFSTQTAYGLAVRGVIHDSLEQAFDFSTETQRSLNQLGWNINELIYTLPVQQTITAIVTDLHT